MTDETGLAGARAPRFGATLERGGTLFRIWAPKRPAVALAIEGADPLPMQAVGGGWFERRAEAPAGTLYRFLLDDGTPVPDPASRFQPHGVDGPSEVIDPDAYGWTESAWPGRPWTETVLYELHVGTFSPQGTYAGAAERLAHLKDLGVTAVELMPVATFAGERGWGYDGVLPYAPHPAYGRPEDLKAFVDAAHRHGIAVFLDVVYNHFGPEGNRMPLHAPVFTHRHRSPWGDGVNFDDEGSRDLRDFLIGNALHWIGEYRMDGLRLDAVQAIVDDSAEHFLAELARRVREAFPERRVHLVVENADNDADLLDPFETAPPLYTAQWNDDIHHVLHVALTGEAGGYYRGYAENPGLLARAVAEGFARQGDPIAGGSPPGKPSAHLPPAAFVSYLQNHDQIGNRALGERITDDSAHEAVRAAAAVYLLAPQIPLLFMGEEWAASTPFPFFCDFHGALAEAVRKGRREEFAHFPQFCDPEILDRIPDPVAPGTMDLARLDWSEKEREPHRAMLAWYRRALAARQAEIVPLLPRIRRGGVAEAFGRHAFAVRFALEGDGGLAVIANLSGEAVARPRGLPEGRTIWAEGETDGDSVAPWSVRWVREA